MDYKNALKIIVFLALVLAIFNTGCLTETTPVTPPPTATVAPVKSPVDTVAPSANGETTEVEDEHEEGEDHHGIPHEFQDMANPFSASQTSIIRGLDLYTANCASCHGPEGRGDGHMAMMLEPKPSNLHDAHVQENSDGGLFYMISNGVEGTAMSPFSQISEEDRWHLVNYLRTFELEAGEAGAHMHGEGEEESHAH